MCDADDHGERLEIVTMTKVLVGIGLMLMLGGVAGAENTMRVKNLKVLAVIYRGTPGEKDYMDDHTVTMARDGLEVGRRFYFRNSRARLNVEFAWLIVDGVAPRNDGPTMDYIEADLRERGVKDGEYDGLVVTGVGLTGNFGGFTVLGGTGACFGSGNFPGTGYPEFDPDTGYGWAWIFAHEFQHALDLVIVEGSGLKMLSAHPYSDHNEPFFRGCYQGGAHWDWIALTLREFDDYLQIKGVRNDFLSCVDADGDGLPDDDPRLPGDEKRFGSDSTKKDTDGDGLDDLGEFTADRFGGSDPHQADTDGDGLTDDIDPYPVVAIRPTLAYRPVSTNTTAHAAVKPDLPLLLDSVFARNDVGGQVAVYAGWNEEALQFVFVGPRKFAVDLKIDGSATNGFWEGGDTYLMHIAEDKVEFSGLGLHGAVPLLQKAAAEVEDGYCLAVNISAKLGQGVSKEINYGGPREPSDVTDGLTLVAGRSIAFNFIYKFADGTQADLTPNHTMYATRLVKPADAPDHPLLRGPAATRAAIPVAEVLGVRATERVRVVRAADVARGGPLLGARIGPGPVELVGLTADGKYELQATSGSTPSNVVTLTVDRSADPPKLTVKGDQVSAECEPGAEFELWWGTEGVPVAPLGGGLADHEGHVALTLGDDLAGWTVTGFEGSRFAHQVFVGTWDKIDRNFEGGPADPRLPADEFALRFEGLLKIDRPGGYTFELSSDDGSRLWIDGELAVNNWGHHGLSARSATVPLDSGLHAARIDYYEEDGWAGVKFRYAPQGGALSPNVPIRRAPLPVKELEFFGVQTDRLGNRSAFGRM
jgi:hypothetical protein